MGHSRTALQNTAGAGFPADPIDGSESRIAVPECAVATCD